MAGADEPTHTAMAADLHVLRWQGPINEVGLPLPVVILWIARPRKTRDWSHNHIVLQTKTPPRLVLETLPRAGVSRRPLRRLLTNSRRGPGASASKIWCNDQSAGMERFSSSYPYQVGS